MNSREITAGPGCERCLGREDHPLGLLVEARREGLALPASGFELGAVDGQLRRVQDDLAHGLVDEDLDVDLPGEGGLVEVGGQAQRVSARLDAVGQAVASGRVVASGRRSSRSLGRRLPGPCCRPLVLGSRVGR